MDQELFYAPSVFSYFSPQNRLENGLLGPEFQIYSTQTAANRADIVNAILYGTLDASTTFDLTPFVQCGEQCQRSARLHQLRISATVHVRGLRQAATTAAECGHHAHGKGAGRTLHRVDFG